MTNIAVFILSSQVMWAMDDLNKKWIELLKINYEKKFNKRIKNSDFATYYNLEFSRSITSETARRWILGLTLPSAKILQEIGIWLDIDFSKFLNDTPHIDWNFFSNTLQIHKHHPYYVAPSRIWILINPAYQE